MSVYITFNQIKQTEQYAFKIDDILNKSITDDEKFEEIYKKLQKSESSYHSRNKGKNNNDHLFCSLLFFYPFNTEIDVKYSDYYKYTLDIKIKNIPKTKCEEYVNKILIKSNNNDRKSYFIKDTNMEKYILNNKLNDNDKCNLYLLKIHSAEKFIDLLKNKYLYHNKITAKILNKHFNEINMNNSTNNIIDNIWIIFKFYEKFYNFKWIKSQGEYYSLIDRKSVV